MIIAASRFTFDLVFLPDISKMENIQEIVSKTVCLTEVVPQSVQWALLGLGAFKVAEHLLAFAKGKVLEVF